MVPDFHNGVYHYYWEDRLAEYETIYKAAYNNGTGLRGTWWTI